MPIAKALDRSSEAVNVTVSGWLAARTASEACKPLIVGGCASMYSTPTAAAPHVVPSKARIQIGGAPGVVPDGNVNVVRTASVVPPKEPSAACNATGAASGEPKINCAARTPDADDATAVMVEVPPEGIVAATEVVSGPMP